MANTLKILTDSFVVSTMAFSRHLKGAYLELLLAQNQNGPMALSDIQTILGGDFDTYWESKLKPRFEIDKQGRFYNATDIRMKELDKPTSSEEMIQREIDLAERRKAFVKTIEPFVSIYGQEKCNAFYKCWAETNKSKTKMRWELQPTWEIGKRIKKFKLFKPFNKKKIYEGSVKAEPLTAEDLEFKKRYEELKQSRQETTKNP